MMRRDGLDIPRLRDLITSPAAWRFLSIAGCVLMLITLFWKSSYHLDVHKYSTGYRQRMLGVLKTWMPIDDTDWSRFAYCQYVTNPNYLCNSLMIFESLTRLQAKPERVMLYPETWSIDNNSTEAQLLTEARDLYGVNLVPIVVQTFGTEVTWAQSFTKLLAFNQTQYKRVLMLDSDATILQPPDELFLLPSAPVAMPRAYWLEHKELSSQLLLVEPSEFEFGRIQQAFENRADSDFDMEIVNHIFGDNCAVIPHRRYDLLTGEFRETEHHKYLGSKEEVWDPVKILNETKYVHFSDWPLPKPWHPSESALLQQVEPKCILSPLGKEDCRDQEVWKWLYEDYRKRRKDVCGLDLVK